MGATGSTKLSTVLTLVPYRKCMSLNVPLTVTVLCVERCVFIYRTSLSRGNYGSCIRVCH
jgi:hypothetical protein